MADLDPSPEVAPKPPAPKPALKQDPQEVMIVALGGGGAAAVIVTRILAALDTAGWRFISRDDERNAVAYRVHPLIDGETL